MGGVGPLSFRAWKDGGPPQRWGREPQGGRGSNRGEGTADRALQRQKWETDGGVSAERR